MNLVPHSIRWRMQLWHGALLALVLAGFAITAWRLQWADDMRQVDIELQQQMQAMLGMMHGAPGGPGGPDRDGPPRGGGGDNPFLPPLFGDDRPPPPRGAGRAGIELHEWANEEPGVSRYFKVWSGPELNIEQFGGRLSAKVTAPLPYELPERDLTPMHRMSSMDGRITREVIEIAQRGMILLAGRTLEPELKASRLLAWQLTGLGMVIWLVAFIGGGWLTKRALRPVGNISAAAIRISSGHLDERINVEEADSELGQMATVLNDTFARLHLSFEQQAQFTADAAHELRTPLSVLLSQTQLALSRERAPEEYRTTLEACQRSAKRMHALVESLLELAKLDAAATAAKHVPLDLAAIARDVIEQLQTLADEQRLAFSAELWPAAVKGDEGQLAQVITNVVSNALHHSAEGATIQIATGTLEGEAFVRVTDQGPGIAAEHLPYLFDRFYRAEASRNRNTGGAGLGLAICQTIAKAHGGRMAVESEVGKGSTFSLRVPERVG